MKYDDFTVGKNVNRLWGDPKLKKFGIIFVLFLTLLIPIAILSSIIDERSHYKHNAELYVEQSWAAPQVIYAPKLCTVNNNEDCFVLDNYSATVKINAEMRHKGIFDIPVYTADVSLKGDFIIDKKPAADKLFLSFKVNDPKGFIETPLIIFDNNKIYSDKFVQSLTNNLKKGNVPFELKYKLRGTNDISVVLSGLKNNVNIFGNWGSPSFIGDYLPITSSIDNEKFNAVWSVPNSSSNEIYEAKAGVSLNIPVDNYRMSERALKYASLFIGLTFLIYFIFEIVSKETEKIHPLQYCLLAASMLVFYLLLVAFSEFIPFVFAYLASAFMVISLICSYTYFVLSDKKLGFTLICCLLLIALYLFLYILLSLQEFAFIIGSIGLFVILAVIMFVTRKVNWYSEI